MLNFFETIIGYVELIWNFFLNLLQSLLTLLVALLQALTLPNKLVMFAPSFMAASILAVGAIAAIKLIIGRDNA